jgi:serine/threonine protein kinase
MMKDIVEKPVPMKEMFSLEAKSLLSSLLERNPKKRLGNGPNGSENIKSHPFFAHINWLDLDECKIRPPFKPVTAGPEDCRQIDRMFLDEPIKETPD